LPVEIARWVMESWAAWSSVSVPEEEREGRFSYHMVEPSHALAGLIKVCLWGERRVMAYVRSKVTMWGRIDFAWELPYAGEKH
jgi:hypothetical protein